MDKSNEANLSTLKEMLLDEDKLITYVSLSKELCVHVNESKSLLSKIVDYVRKNHPDINVYVNYIISGLSEDNKALTKVCPEAEVDNVKKALKSVFFQHIYSVAKGLPTVDNVAYIAINKFEDFPLCIGLIKSNLCAKRSSDEIGHLKSNSQVITVKDTKPVVPMRKIKEENRDVKKESEATTSNGIVRESKSETIVKKGNSPTKTDVKNNKSQKGIAGFFNKTNNVAKKSKNDIVSVKLEKETSVPNNVKTEELVTDIDVEMKEIDIDNGSDKITSQENKSKNKDVIVKKKNAKVDKKRKRLLHVSDSESEDETNNPFADDTPVTDEVNVESDDEIPPTPAVNTVKITSGIVNPKKRRKIVDKTYTDEDGYILTKKEEIYESCSENEEIDSKENIQKVNKVSPKKKNNIPFNNKKAEVSPNGKKIGTKVSKKKISPPQKGKQATLMNFFKKV